MKFVPIVGRATLTKSSSLTLFDKGKSTHKLAFCKKSFRRCEDNITSYHIISYYITHITQITHIKHHIICQLEWIFLIAMYNT